MQDCLFQKVKCKAYLKKVYDGRYIQVYGRKETESGNVEACYMEGSEASEIPCEMDGSLDFIKTYYERKEKEFSGFVAGLKEITITACLTAIYDDNQFFGDQPRFLKYPKDIVKCAIVYYGNNRKRYVPVEDLGILEPNQ